MRTTFVVQLLVVLFTASYIWLARKERAESEDEPPSLDEITTDLRVQFDPADIEPGSNTFRVCSELKDLEPHDDQVFLYEVIRLHCHGARFVENFLWSAGFDWLGHKLKNRGSCDFSRFVEKDASGTGRFRALLAAFGLGKEYSSPRIYNMMGDSVLEKCDLCEVVRGFKMHGHLMHGPGFVLTDPFGVNYGRLSSGMDWWCKDDSSLPLEGRKATVKACRLVTHFRQQCPDVNLADFLEFMDWPLLKGFFVAQDAFQVRPNPTAGPGQEGGDWLPHPKVGLLPLSANDLEDGAYLAAALSEKGISATFAKVSAKDSESPRPRLLETAFGTNWWRGDMKRQLEDLGHEKITENSRGDEYLKRLRSAKFIASPPGFGSDCYRHWQALLSGCVPVVLPSSVAHASLRRLPKVIVDDYSLATPEALASAYRELVAEGRASMARPVSESIMAPLTLGYWAQRVHDVGLGLVLPALSEDAIGPWIRRPLATEIDSNKEAVAVAAARSNLTVVVEDFTLLSGDLAECPCQCGLCGDVVVNHPEPSAGTSTRPYTERPLERIERLKNLWWNSPSSCDTLYSRRENLSEVDIDTRGCVGAGRRRARWKRRLRRRGSTAGA